MGLRRKLNSNRDDQYRGQSTYNAAQSAPQGLFDRSPPGFSYTQVAPPPGYKYAYSADGQRYTVPETYEYASRSEYETAITGTQLGGDPIEGQTFGPYMLGQEPEGFVSGDSSDVTNVPDDLAGELGVETFDTGNTGNTMENGTGQQVVVGSPQTLDEVNVVDYMGVRAADPTLQTGMKLEDEFKDIEIKDTELQDYTKLSDTDPTITAPSAGEAETVTAPDIADTQFAELTEAGVVDRPELAKTSAVSVSDKLVDTEAARGEVSDEALVDAAQMDPLSTKVGSLSAAQIFEATQVKAPASRTLQSGEMVQAAADAQRASAFVEQIQAAQADPSKAATVQGQLENLMKDFDEGDTPAWAAGALRAATAAMAARGLGSSSLAGQAIVQAAMESALPIAQADAATVAQFESQNLSNRQQRAMLAAQQRAQFMGQEFDQQFQARVQNAAKISDIANINFNAEQQIALENARLAQTANLANLNNRQALVMAEAAQIANLETANLNNRQQAAVQNAQAFLQMDFANLSNEQQALMFDAEARVQALFSDQAAENTARNINAASENELAQFYAELSQSVVLANTAAANANSQFNATTFNQAAQFAAELGLTADTFNAEAINDRAEFTAEMANDVAQFNATMKNNREQFNVSNQIAIDANNIQWRRDVNTANTAAENAAIQFDISSLLGIQESALNNIWNHYDSVLNMAWRSEESSIDRTTQILLATMSAEIQKKIADEGNTTDLIGDLFKAGTIFLGSESGSDTRKSILDFFS